MVADARHLTAPDEVTALRFTTLLFDLDGTLSDPGEGICRCFLEALREVGLPEPSRRDLELCIGPPLRQGFLDLGAEPDQVDDLIEIYRSCYRDGGRFENVVYPEVPALLETLRSSGCRLFVATSKSTQGAEAILEHFGLREFFVEVFGAVPDGSLSDKRDLVAHIQKRLHFDPAETALVGDRVFDIRAARASGLYSVGALWGYGSRAELVEAKADALAEAPSCVPGVLDIPRGRAGVISSDG